MTVTASTFKASITRLKNKITDDGVDEKTTNIIELLTNLYGLVERLNGLEKNSSQKDEVSISQGFAYRFISKKENIQLFDEVSYKKSLKNILMAIYIIQATYDRLIRSSYRTESELSNLAEDVNKLKEQKKEYINLLEIASTLSTLEKEIENAEQVISNIASLESEIEDYKNKVTESLDQTSTVLDEIEDNLEESKRLLSETDNNNASIDKQLVAISENEEALRKNNEDLNEFIDDTKSKFEAQSIDIQKIIDNANRASMAGSFKTRKDEITISIRWLDGFTYIVLFIIFGILLYNAYINYNHEDFNFIKFISRITITLPLVWLAWLTSRKSAYLTRIREDYAYKYSSAVAFEGYKKQAEEISEELEERLMEIAITNLGHNPIRLFNGKVKHTLIDYEKFVDNLSKLPQEQLDKFRNVVIPPE